MSLALVRSCLGLFPFVPSFVSYKFIITLLLLLLCLLLPLASSLQFPCARYTVRGTHLVHGIPVPYSQCKMVNCISRLNGLTAEVLLSIDCESNTKLIKYI